MTVTPIKKTRVRKAVFPVAGLGTRFLPATKASPKEMLPIVDKPIIQYGVEEAIAAGIDEIIFVTSRSKRSIEDHFDTATELETLLALQGKHALLAELRRQFPDHISYASVRQTEPKGLGHAILCARHVVGDEPFAVILPDDVMDAREPVLAQMVEQFEEHGGSVVAVEQVERSDTRKYGIVETRPVNGRLEHVRRIVEKPAPEDAPSTLAVVGRYILTPEIFDCIEACAPGVGGEIQLTDGIQKLSESQAVFAYRFAGERFDCGSKLGFLAATLNFGLKHPEVAEPFAQLLHEMSDERVAAAQATRVHAANGRGRGVVNGAGALNGAGPRTSLAAGSLREPSSLRKQ
jgi:UTP--glucose-1-phosphate uridylyltransferase